MPPEKPARSARTGRTEITPERVQRGKWVGVAWGHCWEEDFQQLGSCLGAELHPVICLEEFLGYNWAPSLLSFTTFGCVVDERRQTCSLWSPRTGEALW